VASLSTIVEVLLAGREYFGNTNAHNSLEFPEVAIHSKLVRNGKKYMESLNGRVIVLWNIQRRRSNCLWHFLVSLRHLFQVCWLEVMRSDWRDGNIS